MWQPAQPHRSHAHEASPSHSLKLLTMHSNPYFRTPRALPLAWAIWIWLHLLLTLFCASRTSIPFPATGLPDRMYSIAFTSIWSMAPVLFNEARVILKNKRERESKYLRPKWNVILLDFLLYNFTLTITGAWGQGNAFLEVKKTHVSMLIYHLYNL